MPSYVRLALLPLVVALPFVTMPAHAISTGSGGTAAATPAAAAQPSKKQLKQQRKLARKCAKLSAGKIKKASKRAKYQKLCAQPTGSTPPTSGAGAGPDVEDDQGNEATGGSKPDSQGGGSNAGGGGSNAGGGSSAGGAPNGGGPAQDYLDELLDLPPIFTPPPGGAEEPSGDVPQTPVLDVAAPTNDVPEPGSLALLGLGLVGLGLARRRAR